MAGAWLPQAAAARNAHCLRAAATPTIGSHNDLVCIPGMSGACFLVACTNGQANLVDLDAEPMKRAGTLEGAPHDNGYGMIVYCCRKRVVAPYSAWSQALERLCCLAIPHGLVITPGQWAGCSGTKAPAAVRGVHRRTPACCGNVRHQGFLYNDSYGYGAFLFGPQSCAWRLLLGLSQTWCVRSPFKGVVAEYVV